jgi:hypothetical protein
MLVDARLVISGFIYSQEGLVWMYWLKVLLMMFVVDAGDDVE